MAEDVIERSSASDPAGADPKPRRGRPAGSGRERDPKAPRRLSLVIGPDGKLQTDGMRDTTRAEIAAVLPQLRREFAPAETSDLHAGAPPWVSAALTQALSQISVALITRISGAPIEIVAKHAPLTDEEQARVAPALDAVLSKHGGRWLSKYGDELALGVLILAIGQNKLAAVSQAWQAEQSTLRSAMRHDPDPRFGDFTAKAGE